MSSSHVLYPKPLPPLDKQTLPNENGFTSTEIAALRNGWRLVKRRFIYHTKQIFMEFFQEHDPLLESFRDEMGKFNVARLHQHPLQLLHIYGSLIENGLDDMTYVNVLMADISQRHKMHGVTYADIKLHTDHISLYILQYLEKIISASFVFGLEKLSELINSHHRDMADDKEELEGGSSESIL